MWADEVALQAAGRRIDEWESAFADRAAKARALSAMPAARTAQQILETTRAAHADLLRQVTAAATETLGDDPAGQAVVDPYRRRLETEPGSPDVRR